MAHLVVPASAEGEILVCTEGLSFWGGVDPTNGTVIDIHHPQFGQSLAGKIVLMPTSRGSCTGSGVLLELAMNGIAPAALVFREHEDILTLGAMVATNMFNRPIAVAHLSPVEYDKLASETRASIAGDEITTGTGGFKLDPLEVTDLELTDADRDMLNGQYGDAAKLAIETLCAMAAAQGAKSLTDVTRAHIDGCIYASPANLVFAEKMVEMDAKVRVPTTMNAISVDHHGPIKTCHEISDCPPAGWRMPMLKWVHARALRAHPICSKNLPLRMKILDGRNPMPLFLPTVFSVPEL